MNVRRVLAPNPGPFTGEGTNTYVLDSDGEAIVIDPGPNDERHLQAIATAVQPFTPKMILVTHTHEDHAPGANPLAVLLAVPTAGYGPGPEFKPDRILSDNDIVEFGGATVQRRDTVPTTSATSRGRLCSRATISWEARRSLSRI